MLKTAPRLSAAFNPRANGLNLFRLILAASVIVTHSYPITGREEGWEFMRSAGVDGFFAISGFLIASSWVRRPKVLDYLRARLLRILPGLWACLLVTAVAIAPLATALAGDPIPHGYPSSATTYFLQNFMLTDQGQSIAGTLNNVPYPNAWNSSLWTLRWEFFCYLGVIALGLLGLVTASRFIGAAFIGLTIAQAVVFMLGTENYWITSPVRFALMFVAGMLIYSLRDCLPVTPALVAGAVVVVLVASTFIPGSGYRATCSAFYAYALLAGSTFLRSPRLQMRNDISYGTYIYGFPVQQTLASTALVSWHPVAFAAVAIVVVLPLATTSWFFVEKPAQRFRAKPMRAHAPPVES
ncbi:acyltransferase [Aeromicrobium sp. 50.2.37]|uniref:acyltransferase family protein n=1 Tax=Aeromicrobium sp. 50.2.37 TaxID=2969305 RepID=UPI0021505660|nr:acyltransferase [Aeromicrobium sp. 50.2.37]MCR4513032.1 acyltransferase [Aeromicrobium sp. 50.2.37]